MEQEPGCGTIPSSQQYVIWHLLRDGDEVWLLVVSLMTEYHTSAKLVAMVPLGGSEMLFFSLGVDFFRNNPIPIVFFSVPGTS
jgi:hypothetical protein